MNKILKNNLGFTLTEIMVGVGIMGVIATVIMNFQKQAVDTTKDLVIDSEINTMLQSVASQLNRKEVCELNFKGKPVVQASITKILQRTTAGIDVNILSTVAPDNKYSNEITITAISTSNGSLANQLNLNVSYQVRSRAAQTLTVPINYYLDSGTGNILSCYSDLQFMLRKAVEYACQGNGARYIPPTGSGIGSCEHEVELRDQVGTVVNVSANSFLCPVGQFLQKIQDGTCSVAPNTNTTSTACTAASGVWSPKMVFRCGSINSTCNAWEYLKGYNADGTPQCQDLRQLFATSGFIAINTSGTFVAYNISCASNEILRGINADGSPNCVNPEYNQNCPAGRYSTGVDGSGNITCATPSASSACSGGTPFIKSINNNGVVTCQSGAPGGSCSPGSTVINGIDGSGNVTCVGVPL